MQTIPIPRTFDFKWMTAVSIIVGTSIGAGMLGLPVETARAGFFPSISFFFLSWFITIITGILFSEVILSQPLTSNYISIGRTILGNKITLVIFGLYILLFYSLIAAYTKGIGTILASNLSVIATPTQGSCLFILLFLPLMYLGTHFIGKINTILTIILLLSFFILIGVGNPNISFDLLKHQNWSYSLFSLPLLISSFGFHGTLPSLVEYLERDKRKIRWAIVIGSTITLLIYLSWELLILGSVPLEGEISLLSAWRQDQTAITPLSQISGNPMIWNLAHIFSLSAIITSFLGVSIGLVDFLVDAFGLKKGFITKTTLLASLYISALLWSMTDLRIFYIALNYGAGISGIFLLTFLPALMLYKLGGKEADPIIGLSQKATIPFVFLFSAVAIASCLLGLFFH